MRQVMDRSPRPRCLRLRVDVYESDIGGDIALLRQDADNADWLRPSRSIADPNRHRRLVAVDVVTSGAEAEQLLRRTCARHPWANELELPRSGSSADGVGVACLLADILLDPAPYRLGEDIPTVGDTIGPTVGMHATPWPYNASTPTTDGEDEAVRLLLEEFVSELPGELWRKEG